MPLSSLETRYLIIGKYRDNWQSCKLKTLHGRFESGSILCNSINNKKDSVWQQVWINYDRRQQNICILCCKLVRTLVQISGRHSQISSSWCSIQFYIPESNTTSASLLYPMVHQNYFFVHNILAANLDLQKPSSSIKIPNTCNRRDTAQTVTMKFPDRLHKGLLDEIIRRGALDFVKHDENNHQERKIIIEQLCFLLSIFE